MKKLLIILCITVLGCASSNLNNTALIDTYPKIEDNFVTENYCGNEIEDHYRNIENIEAPNVSTWIKKQTMYAEGFLKRIKGRESFIRRIHEIDNRKSYLIQRSITTENNNRFYLKKNIDETNYKLYFQ